MGNNKHIIKENESIPEWMNKTSRKDTSWLGKIRRLGICRCYSDIQFYIMLKYMILDNRIKKLNNKKR